MKHFNARTIVDAVSLLREYKKEAKIVAGGVDLVNLMKNKIIVPKALINIKTLSDQSYITEDAEGLKIGALTTLHEIERSPIIREKYAIIAQAAYAVGAPQIRNMATLGGNLCQEVQCWYYRRSPITGISFACWRKGGKRCYAIGGEDRYHAIFNEGKCWAVCPSDLAPALVALDASLRVASVERERMVPLNGFYTSLETVLEPDELILEIHIPNPRPGTRQQYLKFRERKTIDYAIASVAVAISVESGVVTDARIVLGGVSPIPYRAYTAEKNIEGETISKSLAELSAESALGDAVPLSGNTYKIPISKALVKRAIGNILS